MSTLKLRWTLSAMMPARYSCTDGNPSMALRIGEALSRNSESFKTKPIIPSLPNTAARCAFVRSGAQRARRGKNPWISEFFRPLQSDPAPWLADAIIVGMAQLVAQSATATLLRCRRCKRQYELPAQPSAAAAPPLLLTACPHCGAAPVPLWRRISRHNGIAAILAVVAIVVLAVADVMPFISMSKLGEQRIFSLVGGIIELFDRGNWFIGAILLVFSVIFPFAKLIALLAATSALARLSPQKRQRLHHLAMLTGKYSLLDLLVVAIMIVLVKFDGIAEVRALPGTILFGVAILLSILSGVFVDLSDADEDAAHE
jgi:paraquat-inducible protein A